MSDSGSREVTLTVQQSAAVMSEADAVLVVASAGSGKTEVVARRVERLLLEHEESFGRVLAVTYTVKAAAELRQRFTSRLGGASRRVDTETIHGFCHTLLRQYGTNIGLPVEPELLVRDEDRVELLERWLTDKGMGLPEDTLDVLRRLDHARSICSGAPLLREWEGALDQAGALDYAALLVAATRLLEVKSVKRQIVRLYEQIVVDEAQNLTPAQYMLLTNLFSDADGEVLIPTMFVGDDKQSIVSFAGADPMLMMRFATDFRATRYDLSENFRSAKAIAEAAEAIAAQLGHPASVGRYAAQGEVVIRNARNEEAEGELVADWIEGLLLSGFDPRILASDEASAISPEDIAVLGRSGAALRFVTASLEGRGIACVTSSSSNDWLSSEAGRVVLEIISLRTAADHRSTHWQLARLLKVQETQVRSIDDLRSTLSRHVKPAFNVLASLTDHDHIEGFMIALQQVALPEDSPSDELAGWQADVEMLRDTWSRFSNETDRANATWGNFKLFCARQQKGDELAPGVRVSTIHKAQGREFRAVVIVGLTDGQLPDFRATSSEELTGELRAFYVGISRARRSLLLTWPMSRATRYGSRGALASRFLQILGA